MMIKNICLSIIILTANINAQAPENNNHLIVGIQTGIKDIRGYYQTQLEGGYFFEVFSFFPVPLIENNFINKYLSGDVNLTYSTYSLSNSKSSDLISSSFKLGPVISYPAFEYFHPFLGASAGFEYLYLTTSKTNISDRTYKPSFSAKTGFLVPLESSFMIRITAEYTIFELSRKKFHDIKYGAAVAYNFKFYDEEEITAIRSALEYDTLYDEGIALFKKGDGQKAKINFRKISEDDSTFRDVKNYLDIIENNEEKYNRALKLIDEKKLADAMPILIETEKYFLESRNKLAEVRKLLINDIQSLEVNAIKSYDNKEYSECINLLNKLQMIDPENETYKLYYPKALKRYKAVKLLE